MWKDRLEAVFLFWAAASHGWRFADTCFELHGTPKVRLAKANRLGDTTSGR